MIPWEINNLIFSNDICVAYIVFHSQGQEARPLKFALRGLRLSNNPTFVLYFEKLIPCCLYGKTSNFLFSPLQPK